MQTKDHRVSLEKLKRTEKIVKKAHAGGCRTK